MVFISAGVVSHIIYDQIQKINPGQKTIIKKINRNLLVADLFFCLIFALCIIYAFGYYVNNIFLKKHASDEQRQEAGGVMLILVIVAFPLFLISAYDCCIIDNYNNPEEMSVPDPNNPKEVPRPLLSDYSKHLTYGYLVTGIFVAFLYYFFGILWDIYEYKSST